MATIQNGEYSIDSDCSLLVSDTKYGPEIILKDNDLDIAYIFRFTSSGKFVLGRMVDIARYEREMNE